MSMAVSTVLATRAPECSTVSTETGFDEIVRQYQKKVYRVLLLMLRDPDEADNLTQECFLRAYLSRKKFRGECSQQTWLLRIAMNLARDRGRSRRFAFWRRLLGVEQAIGDSHAGEPPSPLPSPERDLLAREALDAVWRAVSKLSARQKEVFVLRFLEEMELKEIADVLNLRPGTVKAQLFRAVNSVREQVGR